MPLIIVKIIHKFQIKVFKTGIKVYKSRMKYLSKFYVFYFIFMNHFGYIKGEVIICPM